jgi:lysylphosphatidylglycerol synthetase-like protein (DUF2156 family)
MTALERQTLPIPFGQHVYVLSDLSLAPSAQSSRRPIGELRTLLADTDDAATVIIAGNLFFPTTGATLGEHVRATLAALPALTSALRAFCAHEGHRLVVLPGSDDADLAEDADAQAALRALGAELASDVVLQVATADGVRDLTVCAGSYEIDLSKVDAGERADADRLDDPNAITRFVASRVLYRRRRFWFWLPFALMAIFDLWSTLLTTLNHLSRHLGHHHFDVDKLHPNNFWSNVLLNIVVIGSLEAVIAGVVGVTVRRRFDRRTRRRQLPELSEPLSLTRVDGVDAVEIARRCAERGGVGAIIGGAPRPALAFLDRGVAATPGPSRSVVIERRGRLGLPPVFTTVDRIGIIEVEAASTVQVRLYAGQSPRQKGRLLERLVGARPAQPSPDAATQVAGSWPSGDPFPVNVDRLAAQRRQRSIRRWASGLLFLDGALNVARTVAPPLRGRLHAVLSVLPVAVAQSAAAITAVAGIAMIMLARGIRRGQRRAWFISVVVLAVTIVGHVARGGSFLNSLVAAAIFSLLIIERRYFQATTDRSSIQLALPRLGLIALITVLGATLGIETADRHAHLPAIGVVFVACVERLVGQYNITLPDRLSDFINPVLLTVGLSLVVSAFYLLTRPVVDRRLSSASRSGERRVAERRARDIVRRHGRGTLDYFALRDDKQFFFFRDSMVAYAVYGGVALLSPDPIGPVAERSEAFSAFRTYAESRGWTIGVMGAGEEWLPIYHAAGLHTIYLGDEAIVNCQQFTLEGGKMKGLRQACSRLAKKGYTVDFLDPSDIAPERVPDILDLITMLRRGEGERGFSMMLGRLFNPKDKGLLLTVVHDPDGKPVAVCQFVPSPAINGYSLDLMRRDPGDHPNGLIDYALCSTIAYLKEHDGRGLSLNFSAFRSVLDGERGEGTFTRVERWALRRLSGVLPIETLWSFNAKYYPDWLPRFLVYPAAESFVPVVAAILRAESITELPVFGRFLANDPANRPGTVVPDEVLEAAKRSSDYRA